MPTQTNDLSDHALIDLPEARRYVWRDENDSARDDILIDAINDVSEAIVEHCEREFADTTTSDRSGADGVGNGSTTFTSATAAFVAGDAGAKIRISGTIYTIASVTNGTTVVLDATLATGTGLTWDFGESRAFVVSSSGYVDFRPYDLREAQSLTLYADRSDLDDEVVTDYQLQNEGPPSRSWYAVRITAPAFAPLHEGFATIITVRGWWGMPAVPGGVKLAAKQWVKNVAENPGAYASSTMNDYGILPDTDTITVTPAGMPMSVRMRLENWRRGYTFR